MVGNQGLPEDSEHAVQQRKNAAEDDVWAQLEGLASRQEADPVLRLLVGEAIGRFAELRGVTATIASRFRAMVDAVPDAVIIHDESGQVLDANEAACRLYGLERESLLQASMLGLNPGLDSNFLIALHDRQGQLDGLTARTTIAREDGTHADLEMNAREYLDSGRVRIIATVRDLGLRAVALQQLCDSEAWLRRLATEIDKGIIEWNRRGQILSANPAACRVLQMSEFEMRALAVDQLERWRCFDARGASMDRSALPWTLAFETGKPQESMVCGLALPDLASTLWLSIAAVPRFEGGQAVPEKVVCIFSEITTLQRDALMFSEVQMLGNLGAWQFDLDLGVLLCSTQMHAILDVPTSTPITWQRMFESFTGPGMDRLRQAVAAAKEGRSDEFEAAMATTIGRKRRVLVRVRPLLAGTRVRAVFGTLQETSNENAPTA